MADIVYVVRPSAPPGDARNRYWGKSDPGVDAEDLERARRLVPLLWEKPARVLSGTRACALRTAGVIAAELGVEVASVHRLDGLDFGDFDGLTFDEASERMSFQAAEWARQGDAFTFPHGESASGFLSRSELAWRECLALRDKAALVVAHGEMIAVWCCLFLDLPMAERFLFRPDHSSVSSFWRKRDGSGWEMISFNDKPLA